MDLSIIDTGQQINAGTAWTMAWPGKDLDRLAVRVLKLTIDDAVAAARRGQITSKSLKWLWDVGRQWAELLGGEPFKRVISNICEDIEIMGYKAREGQDYHPTGQLGNLLRNRRRNGCKQMTNVTCN